jgi:hypothetical protein
MNYITTHRFKQKSLSGPTNLPYATPCTTAGPIIRCGGKSLCYTTSQNAYDYFARDDDGHGLERGRLTAEIRSRLEKKDDNHQARWDKLWADERANKLRRADHQDFWVWSFDFYNAEISELEHVLSLIKEVG